MKGSVSFWVILLALVLSVSWVVGCRDDVTVPFPPTINGNYIGYYSVMEIDLSTLDTVVDTSQLVSCRFHSGDFTMVKDGSIPESLRVFCDVEGNYVLGNGISMTVTDPNFTRGVCTEDWGPSLVNDTAGYGLDQTTDTMRMLYDESSGNTRWVKLFRLVLE
jgi:hypothetical protein